MNTLAAVSFPAAFVAGLLSFLSPCILPVIPGYLSFISGRSMEELGSGKEKWAVLFRTLFFVAGFSVIFSVLGLIFSGGSLFTSAGISRVITLVAGGIIILFGLNLIFDFLRFLNMELKAHVSKKPASAAGSFLVGMAFGAGWTPCIGPMLASILLLAAQSGSAVKALFLLLTYSLGLGLPFILAGLFFPRLGPVLRWMKEHRLQIRIGSGILLIALGLLMMLGRLTWINTIAARLGWSLQSAVENNPAGAKLCGILLWLLLLALGIVLPLLRHKKLLRPGRLIALAIPATLLVLELSGLLSTASLVSSWLLFQGI
ncbi:MAG: cytochrome c biogenesis protein CcdA [Spirochaetes bacterium]|nr:cytochrome c biogenesis protein CcdA [Spirochaetota bacterium]MBU0955521.1 cytochrome c biogenesis protein CcdA [Spirochaetota bacterium]